MRDKSPPMDIVYQYYNEIVLAFADYEVDFQDGVIVIQVPDDKKPFDSVFSKIETQVLRIADTLDLRDKEVLVRVEKSSQTKQFVLEPQ